MRKKLFFLIPAVTVALSLWIVVKKADVDVASNQSQPELAEIKQMPDESVLTNPTIKEVAQLLKQESDSMPDELTAQEAVETNDLTEMTPTLTPDVPPQSINVDMSPEQHETFLVLDAKFADPLYVSTLSLAELSDSAELQSLPDILKIALITKAVAHYNQGHVSTEVFLSK